MNINKFPEELKDEEQDQLDILIERLNEKIDKLDARAQKFVEETKDEHNVGDPALYAKFLLAKKGMKTTEENIKRLMEGRDELYKSRLLLEIHDENGISVEEFKVGLHSCLYAGENYVNSWVMPVFRHFVLNRDSSNFIGVVKDNNGVEHKTEYKLIAMDNIGLKFTRVMKVLNMVPANIDVEELKEKFPLFWSENYIEKMMSLINETANQSDVETEEILEQAFLDELETRRENNYANEITSWIQQRQAEIMSIPYNHNFILQGCAGTGKSMIMLHRLPLVLYDNPESLDRSKLYVITPSEPYMQLLENLTRQLEIPDIRMGTLKQYYDYCIEKYGMSPAGYGTTKSKHKMTSMQIGFAYSSKLIQDIQYDLQTIVLSTEYQLPSSSEYDLMGLQRRQSREHNTMASKLSEMILADQELINENEARLREYFKLLRDSVLAFKGLAVIVRECNKKYHRTMNELAPQDNRAEMVESITFSISIIDRMELAIDEVIPLLETLDNTFEKNELEDIYVFLNSISKVVGAFALIEYEMERLEQCTLEDNKRLLSPFQILKTRIDALKNMKKPYLSLHRYRMLKEHIKSVKNMESEIVAQIYEKIMKEMGNAKDENGAFCVWPCSAYIFLQILYQFKGAPNGIQERYLSIDEAQGIAVEELRLMQNVNGGRVVFNLYGDIKQQTEFSKGLNDWKNIIDEFGFDFYETNENYRNATEITEYCNKRFGMRMRSINRNGQGVREITSIDEFKKKLGELLTQDDKSGNKAIIVKNRAEAETVLKMCSELHGNVNDMTGDSNSVSLGEWNVITVEDARGLEFNTVVCVSGRMSINEKYIAYTRGLDELVIFDEVMETVVQEKKQDKGDDLKKYFEEKGLEVVDKRKETGHLWVIGTKTELEPYVKEVGKTFKIAGIFKAADEIDGRKGWRAVLK